MQTRRVVMMAFAVSFGTALSASAQTPADSLLINILKRSSKNTSVVQPTSTLNVVPTGNTTNSTIAPLSVPKGPSAAECGPRPPRPV
jgi:hypothetical protein